MSAPGGASTRDTIAARATPAGRGAVAVVRLSGPDAWRLALAVAERRQPPPARRLGLVTLRDATGRALDRCLWVFFPEGASFTGEPCVEFQVHGNPLLVEKLLDRLSALGARHALPGEFTRRAYEHGKLSLTEAEGLRALIDAPGPEAIQMALNQLEGVLSTRFRALESRLVSLIAAFEAGQDYPEEGVESAPQPVSASDLEWLLRETDALLATHPAWQTHHCALRIALTGRPNAGKSSLMNRLLGSERAIVSDIPGTTRDLITATLNLGGRLVELVDTAGLRETADPVELEGVRRAIEMASEAALVVLLCDPATGGKAVEEDKARLEAAGATKILVAYNKQDLHPGFDSRGAVLLSCKTAAGISGLLSKLQDAIGTGNGEALPETAVSERHALNLREARQDLEEARKLLADHAPGEVVMDWLWEALRHVQMLEGEGVTEKMLDDMFSRFCLGK